MKLVRTAGIPAHPLAGAVRTSRPKPKIHAGAGEIGAAGLVQAKAPAVPEAFFREGSC